MQLGRDINGFVTFSFVPTKLMYSFQLAKDSVLSLTLPPEDAAYEIHITPEVGGEVWVSYDGVDPTYPTAATVALTNSEINPVGRILNAGSVLKFITSDTTCRVSVSLFGLSLKAY